MNEYTLIVDFEMCNVKGKQKRYSKGLKREIIQIGAIMVDEDLNMCDSFSCYVKPEYGHLDNKIKELTEIKEEDLSGADSFNIALTRFFDWIGERNVTTYSWSRSD